MHKNTEAANLFNPAFVGAVLLSAIVSYQKKKSAGLPYALAFLILPVVLHAETRASLMDAKRARRIVLAPATQNQIKIMAADIEQATQGMVTIPLRELANFILQVRCGPLSAEEMSELRSRYFDEMKALNWVRTQVQEARTRGESVDLAELLKKVQMQSVGENRAPHSAPRKRRSKTQLPPSTTTSDAQDGLPVAPESAP